MTTATPRTSGSLSPTPEDSSGEWVCGGLVWVSGCVWGYWVGVWGVSVGEWVCVGLLGRCVGG